MRRVVEDYASYRRVSQRLAVSPMTVLRWVNEYGKNAKSPIEIAHTLHPQWSGILGIDGKPIKIAGREYSLLVAVDIGTQDAFYFDLADAENRENARNFLTIIKHVFQYPIKGIVSDFGKGRIFIELVEELFPQVPHQACVVHFSRYVDLTIPKSKKSKYHHLNTVLRDAVNKILFAQNLNDADEMMIRLLQRKACFTAHYHKQILRSLTNNFTLLTAHFFLDELPRDTNIVENIIRQLNRKLLLVRNFHDRNNAYNFFKLWFCAYRFRRFTGSSYSHRNGKSPLEMAGVDTSKIEWLKFSQQKIISKISNS